MDLTTLINTYRGPLIGLIASWGAPWADAAEIAQDSFADAWLKRESCRGDWNDSEVFGRWLRGVALNRYRNWSRSHLRRRFRVIFLASAEWDLVGSPVERYGDTFGLPAHSLALVARSPFPDGQAVAVYRYQP